MRQSLMGRLAGNEPGAGGDAKHAHEAFGAWLRQADRLADMADASGGFVAGEQVGEIGIEPEIDGARLDGGQASVRFVRGAEREAEDAGRRSQGSSAARRVICGASSRLSAGFAAMAAWTTAAKPAQDFRAAGGVTRENARISASAACQRSDRP